MPNIREQAISFINEAPEDIVEYFIALAKRRQALEASLPPPGEVFKRYYGTLKRDVDIKAEPQSPSPWEVLEKYRGSVHVDDDFDYKAELGRYRDERYASPS